LEGFGTGSIPALSERGPDGEKAARVDAEVVLFEDRS
jgi:hypothetical protein